MSRRGLWAVFAVPVVLFLVSMFGLVWALLIEGPADTVAAVAAGVAIPVMAWAWARRSRSA